MFGKRCENEKAFDEHNDCYYLVLLLAGAGCGSVFPPRREKELSVFCRKTLLYLHFQEGLGDFQSDSGVLACVPSTWVRSFRSFGGSLEGTDPGEGVTGSL